MGETRLDVLYVSNRARDRELILEFFEDVSDMTIVPASDAEEAVGALEGGEIDCVVSDHQPPSVHGFDLFERVREVGPRIPFILFPSVGSERLAAEAVERDVAAYLPKDITFAEYGLLENRIRQVVEKVEAERELAMTRARFRALTENTSFAVVTIDESSTIRYANEGVEEVFGYEPDELIDGSLLALVPERLHERHLAGIGRFVEDGVKRLDWEWIELPGLHRRGHEIPLGITFGEATIDGEQLFTGIIRERGAEEAADELTDIASLDPHG